MTHTPPQHSTSSLAAAAQQSLPCGFGLLDEGRPGLGFMLDAELGGRAFDELVHRHLGQPELRAEPGSHVMQRRRWFLHVADDHLRHDHWYPSLGPAVAFGLGRPRVPMAVRLKVLLYERYRLEGLALRAEERCVARQVCRAAGICAVRDEASIARHCPGTRPSRAAPSRTTLPSSCLGHGAQSVLIAATSPIMAAHCAALEFVAAEAVILDAAVDVADLVAARGLTDVGNAKLAAARATCTGREAGVLRVGHEDVQVVGVQTGGAQCPWSAGSRAGAAWKRADAHGRVALGLTIFLRLSTVCCFQSR